MSIEQLWIFNMSIGAINGNTNAYPLLATDKNNMFAKGLEKHTIKPEQAHVKGLEKNENTKALTNYQAVGTQQTKNIQNLDNLFANIDKLKQSERVLPQTKIGKTEGPATPPAPGASLDQELAYIRQTGMRASDTQMNVNQPFPQYKNGHIEANTLRILA